MSEAAGRYLLDVVAADRIVLDPPERTYEVYIGDPYRDESDGPDYVHLREGGLGWARARDLLTEQLIRWRDEEAALGARACGSCLAQANEALASLAWAAPGTVIDAEVDGDAYRLTAE